MTHDKQIQELVEALEEVDGLIQIVEDSCGVTGWHLNGEVAEWSELCALESLLKIRITLKALLAESKRYREALESLPEFNEDGVIVLYSINEIKQALNPSKEGV